MIAMQPVNKLGKYVADRRTKLRLTQEEVVERLRQQGIDRASSTLANWEAGRQTIPIEYIPELAEALEDSAVNLYDNAGILDKLPGSQIIKLLDGLSDDELARVEKVLRAMIDKK